MRAALFLFSALSTLSSATGAAAPAFAAGATYDASTVDGTTRVGAFWPLSGSGGSFPASTAAGSTPPPGVAGDVAQVDSTVDGLEAHVDVATGGVAGDTAFMGNGADKSCVNFTGFSDAADVCLANPGQCTATTTASDYTGFSLSLWLNVPALIETRSNYILDTGGDELGSPGIAIRLRGSTDGRKSSQQLHVLVSTGDKYWKVILNGMILANSWNQLGLRWSPSTNKVDGTDAANGLQVFVNQTSVAMKRSPHMSGFPAAEKTVEEAVMTLGCRRDGAFAQNAKYDSLVFWYWPLQSSNGAGSDEFRKYDAPYTGDHEVTYFRHSAFTFTFMAAPPDKLDPGLTARGKGQGAGSVAPGTPLLAEPWMYTWEASRKAAEALRDESFLDDRSAATDGDCEAEDPSSWNSLAHPMDCADTRRELEDALGYDDAFSGHSLVRALVRVVNRNSLSAADLRYLAADPLDTLLRKLRDDVATAAAGGTELSWQAEGKFYAWFGFVVSGLQDKAYVEEFATQMDATNRGLGISKWISALKEANLLISSVMTENKAILTEANHTVSSVMRTVKSQATAGLYPSESAVNLTFPNLDQLSGGEAYYLFAEQRAESWGPVGDWVRLPIGAFDGWADLTTKIQAVVMMFNQLQLSWPAYLDSRVTGEGVADASFFLNSRLLSLSIAPDMDNAAIIDSYPITMLLEHTTPQADLVFRKGAVVCAHWVFHANGSSVGAWDTEWCRLLTTNDTHSLCECRSTGDFALLQEDHRPSGYIARGGYIFCYVLAGASAICALLFVFQVYGHERLHYELWVTGMNLAFAVFFGLLFYLLTVGVHSGRSTCIFVSVFVHYFYLAGSAWCLILAHYVFRAGSSGRLSGVLTYYCLGGWGLPGLVVGAVAIADISRFGIGERCLGAQNGWFLWVFIGLHCVLLLLAVPVALIGMSKLGGGKVESEEDVADIKMSVVGVILYAALNFLIWVMTIFVYVSPADSMAPDFLWEFLNAFRGIVILCGLGIATPTFRRLFLCCKKKGEDAPASAVLYGDSPGSGSAPPNLSSPIETKHSTPMAAAAASPAVAAAPMGNFFNPAAAGPAAGTAPANGGPAPGDPAAQDPAAPPPKKKKKKKEKPLTTEQFEAKLKAQIEANQMAAIRLRFIHTLPIDVVDSQQLTQKPARVIQSAGLQTHSLMEEQSYKERRKEIFLQDFRASLVGEGDDV